MSLPEHLSLLWLRLRLWWKRPTKRSVRRDIEKFLKDGGYLEDE